MSPHAHPSADPSPDPGFLPDDGRSPSSVPAPGAVRTRVLDGGDTAETGARRVPADDPVDDPVAASAWEEEPPRVPVFRWRLVGRAVAVLVVAVTAWWAVTWLMRPETPDPVEIDPRAALEATDTAPAVAGPGEGEDDGHGDGPSSGRGSAGDGAAEQDEDGPAEDGLTKAAGEPQEEARVRVHVIGEVRSPGVVSVPADARTADAIAAAGGAGRGAQTDRINLAAPLVDGQQVLVPGEDTTEEQLESVQAEARGGDGGAPGQAAEHSRGSSEAGAEAAGPGADAHRPEASGTAAAGAGGDGTVDLNTADSTALQTLPGVGPATAEKIIAHREQVGEFQSLTDLDAVSGIGPATLERLAPLVSW